MTESQIATWIFLSMSETPSSVSDIVESADVINHAIPTDQELQIAFQWLTARGLARREGSKYGYSEEGVALRNKINSSEMTIQDSWAAVEKRFVKM